MMKVKDLMSANAPIFCTPETKLASATKLMKEINRGALPVVNKDHKVVGIVTDRDICLSLANKKDPSTLTVHDILPHSKIHTVTPEDTITDALGQMRKNRIGRLPVTDREGKLKGIISVNTLLSNAIAKKEDLGDAAAKDENLARTIKALFDRNNKKETVELE